MRFFIIVTEKISKATIELEKYPSSLLFSKAIVLSIIYRKLVGKLYSCYYIAHQTLTGFAPLFFFFQKKHKAFTLMTWKQNPQAPLKLNLNPRPSTKSYRKERERERERPLLFRIPFPTIPSR